VIEDQSLEERRRRRRGGRFFIIGFEMYPSLVLSTGTKNYSWMTHYTEKGKNLAMS